MRITLLALVQLGLLLAHLSRFEPVSASYEEELFRQGYQHLSGGEEDATPSSTSSSTTGVTNLLRSWLPFGEAQPRATQARSNYPSRTVEQNVPAPAQVLDPEASKLWLRAGLGKIQFVRELLAKGSTPEVNIQLLEKFINTARAQTRSFRPGSQESIPKAVEDMVKFFSQEVRVVEIMEEYYQKLSNRQKSEAFYLINLIKGIQAYKRSLNGVGENVWAVEQEYKRLRANAPDLELRELRLDATDKEYWSRYESLLNQGIEWRPQPGEGSSRGK